MGVVGWKEIKWGAHPDENDAISVDISCLDPRTHQVDVLHETLLGVDGRYELKHYDAETVDVALRGDHVGRHIVWVHVAVCALQARAPPVEGHFFLGQPKICNLFREATS